MTISGADADALDALAGDVESAAHRLRRSQAKLGSAIHSSPWSGGNAERFRERWDSEYRRSMLAAAAFLDAAGEGLQRNADEQRDASSGDGGRGAGRGRGGLPTLDRSQIGTNDWGLDDKLEALLASAKDLEFIRSTYELTQGELDDVVRLLRNGGFVSEAKIPVIGLLVSAADIGVNQHLHGWGDGRTMFAEVDGAAGLILTPIPGGGMAWSIGTKIGEGASSGIDWLVEAHTGDTPSGHVVTNQLDSRSPGGDWSSLSADEQARIATEVSQRYEGWSGFKNFLWDAAAL